ncbi:hypothetical protein SLEP1_g6812 [Rubroshorea leprosula]|uniref:Uncharacterized protein n=1 Tax=Rubroshorea leprosula TaxID=152421 RepID=A0AAV5HWF4_9ROSI|nr:hypothetical protein SLEP1_g6812 [Rubroshorea leprosula]
MSFGDLVKVTNFEELSSEETVSVGESEEVRALEYGDVGITSESSDSEKMEEGVGRSEMVGVEGDRVPVTVVEVEGRNERCYDIDADIVSEACWGRGEGMICTSGSLDAHGGSRKDKGCLNEDEEEELGKLVREGANLVNIMYLTNADCIEVAKLYGPSALSEAEMDKFLNAVGGVAILKKSRKKSKASTKEGSEVGTGKGLVLNTSARVEEVGPRPELKRKGGEELGALQRKKKVVEQEARRSENSLFDAKNTTGAKRFINTTFPEEDKHQAKEEVLKYCGAIVVKHALECEQLQKEKEELEKKNKDMQEALDEVVSAMKQLEQEKDFEMEEHINNFVNSSSFDNIINLYRLPTTILAFTDCRKKVKAEYPEVDITKITFGEQEERVEENGESMLADFRLEIKLRWDHDEEGRTVFPPSFDFEFVAVEEEEAEVEGVGVEENQPPLPVEVHSIPSDEEQPPQPAEQPPLLAERQPPQPSPLVA